GRSTNPNRRGPDRSTTTPRKTDKPKAVSSVPAETMTGTFGADVLESIGLRSVTTVCDETLSESGTPLDRPLRQVASVAVVGNPWIGGGVEQDLGPEAREVAPVLGKILSDQVVSALGGVDDVATFGKAALVG